MLLFLVGARWWAFSSILIIPVLAIAGLVLGILGLRSQKRGVAIAGTVTSGIGLLLTVGVFVLFVLVASQL